MISQLIVKAKVIGMSFMACCDYSPGHDGDRDEPACDSEVKIASLSVDVSGMWVDCTWLMSSENAEAIGLEIEANADPAYKELRDSQIEDRACLAMA